MTVGTSSVASDSALVIVFLFFFFLLLQASFAGECLTRRYARADRGSSQFTLPVIEDLSKNGGAVSGRVQVSFVGLRSCVHVTRGVTPSSCQTYLAVWLGGGVVPAQTYYCESSICENGTGLSFVRFVVALLPQLPANSIIIFDRSPIHISMLPFVSFV